MNKNDHAFISDPKLSVVFKSLKSNSSQLIHQVIPQVRPAYTFLVLIFELPFARINLHLASALVISWRGDARFDLTYLSGNLWAQKHSALYWLGKMPVFLSFFIFASELLKSNVNLCWLDAHDVFSDVRFFLEVTKLELQYWRVKKIYFVLLFLFFLFFLSSFIIFQVFSRLNIFCDRFIFVLIIFYLFLSFEPVEVCRLCHFRKFVKLKIIWNSRCRVCQFFQMGRFLLKKNFGFKLPFLLNCFN